MLNEAEELAEKGDVEGSKMKQAIFEQTKQKAILPPVLMQEV